MGIESDQLVFDYLSRVGDLAQQRQLSSGSRMRLVSALRGEIDRRRATYGEEGPEAVRGILRQLGTPDEVVDRAAGVAPVPDPPEAELPEQRGRRWRRGAVPKPRTTARSSGTVPGSRTGAPPPHLAGMDDVGAADTEPDWWRTDATPRRGDDLVPGFVGGVEIPELLKPPPTDDDDEDAADADGAVEAGDGPEPAGETVPDEDAAGRRGWLRPVKVRRDAVVAGADGADAGAGATERRFRLANPLLLLAALLLLGGALFGSLLALAFGWLLAYASRRLSRGEIQGAVIVLPGLAATAGAVWIWGRLAGRWGAPIAEGGEAMGAAIGQTWPWVVRGAAVASALFLLWRSQRRV
ncbi:hypothetical protein [Streptomyces sp. NPDC058745]|uniref:hypothetical protein n=1 Tax=Streptomyces sp. NPDC058745 TaxID=3346621 RepID=UPI00367DF5F4